MLQATNYDISLGITVCDMKFFVTAGHNEDLFVESVAAAPYSPPTPYNFDRETLNLEAGNAIQAPT